MKTKQIDIKSLPQTNGVYILKSKQGRILYIGKSHNIRTRVQTHLKNAMRHAVAKVDYIVTVNEPEALIKESELIKKYQPRYNIMLRDDKQYFYVGFTGEKLPKVVLTHQPPRNPLLTKEGRGVVVRSKRGFYIGPFTDGKSLKTVLKYLRRAFPYYTQAHRKLPCQYCHIGLCPGPDPNIKWYKKDIAKIKAILNGLKPRVITSLKKEMAQFAKGLEFEKAAKARDQIRALENIFSHRLPDLNPSTSPPSPLLTKERGERGEVVMGSPLSSLEAYDISNIQGKEPVASMVRFDDGKPNKSMYRKFKIRLPQKPNDTAMIREVIRRRLAHPEWPYPDAFLIDGGRGQLNAALKELRNFYETPPSLRRRGARGVVVALAKRFNELYVPGRKNPVPLDTLPKETKNLLMHARDEAHRFAISYHRKLHRQTFR